jgi:hypothetical protein
MSRTVGRIALTVVGTVVGAFLGNPGLGAAIGSLVGGLIFPAKSAGVGKQTEDLRVQLSTYGAGRPIGWGTWRQGNNRIWVENDRVIKRTKKQKVGKGSPKQTVTTYFGRFADYLCDNPIANVHLIVADGKVIYRAASPALVNPGYTYTGLPAGGGRYSKPGMTFRLYKGSATQSPDPAIVADRGAARTPAYRGQSYIVYDVLPLDDFYGRIPTIQYVLSTVSTTSYSGFQIPDGQVSPVNSNSHPTQVSLDDIIYAYVGNDIVATRLADGSELWRTSILDPLYGYGFLFDGLIVNETHGVVYVLVTDAGPPGPSQLIAMDRFTGAILSRGILPWGHTIAAIASDPLTSQAAALFAIASSSVVDFDIRGTGAPQASPYAAATNFGGVQKDYLGTANGVFWSVTDTTLTQWNYQTVTSASVLAGGGALDISSLPGWVAGETRYLKYEPSTGGVWLFSGARTFLIDGATLMASELTYLGAPIAFDGANHSLGHISGNPNTGEDYWMKAAGTTVSLYRIDPQTMTASLAIADVAAAYGALFTSGAFPMNLAHYSWQQNAILVYAGAAPTPHAYVLYFNTALPGATTLKDITDFVCDRAGYDIAGELDTAALAAVPIGGYSVNDPNATARSALEPVFDFGFVDAVERNGVIDFVPRGGAVVASIAEEELGDGFDDDGGIRLIETKTEALELPVEMRVTFVDPARDWQENSALFQFSTDTTAEGDRPSVGLPITMRPNEALLYAQRKMTAAHEERMTLEFSILPRNIALTPTDVVSLTSFDVTYPRVRLLDREIRPDGRIIYSGVSDQSSAYSFDPGLGAATGTFTPPTPLPDSPSFVRAVDMPALRDLDAFEPFLLHTAIQADPNANWRGADVEVSTDALSWALIGTDIDTPGRAVLSRALPAAVSADAVWYGDLYLTMIAGTAPASVSEADFWRGVNGFIIGSAAQGWEAIYFRSATQEPSGEWKLSTLMRGRRGTEHAAIAWPAGTEILFPDQTTFEATSLPAYVGSPIYVRGAELATGAPTPSISLTFRGWHALPYSPAQIAATRAGNDIAITWLRRARYNNTFRDGAGLIMDEPALEFEIDVKSAPGGVVVDTVASIAAESFTYTSAMQTAAGLTPGAPLTVEIFQISQALRARGRGREATI